MRKKHKRSYWRSGSTVCLCLLAGLAWSASADAQTVGGRAFAAFVNTPTLGAGPLFLSDAGELSANGGWEGTGLLSAQVPGVLSASVLNSATSGGEYDAGPAANSSSSLADVTVLPGQRVQLTASFVSAQVEVTSAGPTGSVEITDLMFGGMSIPVTGVPNQQVAIPLVGTLIINEQTMTYGVTQTITVNALHLVLATGEEIILASARSVLNSSGTGVFLARLATGSGCAPAETHDALWRPRSTGGPDVRPVWAVQECIDFVTGGGFFEPPNSNRPSRVNFGFNAGPRSAQKPGDLKGHLNFIDHGGAAPFFPMMHVRGINVDSYVVWGADPDHCRVFEGDAIVNGVPGFRYKATVCDYDEPGRDDRFMLDVTGPGFAYNADNRDASKPAERGELDGGNIQLHKSKCPKPAMMVLPGRKLYLTI